LYLVGYSTNVNFKNNISRYVEVDFSLHPIMLSPPNERVRLKVPKNLYLFQRLISSGPTKCVFVRATSEERQGLNPHILSVNWISDSTFGNKKDIKEVCNYYE
jgi:hypothetical protein